MDPGFFVITTPKVKTYFHQFSSGLMRASRLLAVTMPGGNMLYPVPNGLMGVWAPSKNQRHVINALYQVCNGRMRVPVLCKNRLKIICQVRNGLIRASRLLVNHNAGSVFFFRISNGLTRASRFLAITAPGQNDCTKFIPVS